MVLTEAMASGLPCITTELGTGTSWIVQDGTTGLVVPPMDPDALAGAIRHMGDESTRQRMGAASLDRVRTLFTQKGMIEQVMRVYEDVLQDGR
jgi:rhamnosyl/mannosyltransferase